MININEIPKYVINLDNRPDRLDHIKKEFDYMNWSFERFSGIDTGSYEGCAQSHMAVAQKAIDLDLEYVMVFEDDTFFMPYAKEFILKSLFDLSHLDSWDLFSLAPTIHRPLNMDRSDNLIDLTNNLPATNDKHRGILGITAMIYSKKILKEILKWPLVFDKWQNHSCQQPMDVFYDKYIYPNFQSYCCKMPIVTQISDSSTINGGQVLDCHYIMTYNWKSYVNPDYHAKYMDINECKKLRLQ